MTQTLNVEKDELLARADELEVPIPVPPNVMVSAPCALSFTTDAAAQLRISADAIRLYLEACQREWRRLARSLRNAAMAYEEVDEEAADAVATNSAVSAVSLGGGEGRMSASCDPDEDYIPPPPPILPPPPQNQPPYYEVRQAATAIEAPDQGTGFSAFAREWDAYQRALQTTTVRFRPFTSWEGEAAPLVEANFEAQRSWVLSMAQLCSTLAAQANTVVSAHRWAITEHPSAYEIAELDKWYVSWANHPMMKQQLGVVVAAYAQRQQKSEEVLAEYMRRGAMPLSPVNPKNPPIATRIDPPPDPDPDPEPGPDPDELPDDELPDDDLPPVTPSTPAATPTVPSAATPPLPDNAELTQALDRLSASPAGVGEGMKPASVGGGGGGVPPIPSMPMQPSMGAESAPAGTPAAARDAGNLGRPGAPGAAMGGGGMGMAPMGAPGAGAGQGQDSKAKSAQGTDEAVYTEDRPWTEAVIGNRRRKDVSDGKETR